MKRLGAARNRRQKRSTTNEGISTTNTKQGTHEGHIGHTKCLRSAESFMVMALWRRAARPRGKRQEGGEGNDEERDIRQRKMAKRGRSR
jgi:hypothetical protein